MIEMLPKAVQEEAALLKKYATKEELSRLDIKTLNPAFTRYCIYGQMTGHCRSKRALELFKLCNPTSETFSELSFGNYENILSEGSCSPIEACIASTDFRKYNGFLIDYLKS